MRRLLIAGIATSLVALAPVVHADEPLPPEAPLLHDQLAAGALVVDSTTNVAPSAKVVDGDISDWTGSASGYGGTIVRSRGELVYTDHIFDAYGADDGGDAERLANLDPLAESVPETYRLDPLYQADPVGELAPGEVQDALAPAPLPKADEAYGDLPHVDAADLSEVRLAADAANLYVLARTTTMKPGSEPTLLVRVDGVDHLLRPGDPDVVFNADGWTNAVEAKIRHHQTGKPATKGGYDRPPVSVVVAAGTGTGDSFVPANVAFRTHEPVRTWWDKQQALELHAGELDTFAIDVDPDDLAHGATDSWHAGPGYFDRIFTSSEAISTEGGQDGITQHYGVYLPEAYGIGSQPVPMTVWLHWRGGKAHSAAAVSPRIFRDFGEGRNGIVIAPRGRGSSTWWIGEGMSDFLEVWADATTRFNVDMDRVALSGHSMGGNGSYVLSMLMPDRFSAALPVEGPVTQGAWTGLDFEGCDDYHYREYSFCYVQTNEGDARAQHTLKLLDNLRNTPIAIYQGVIDELVPVSGTTRQVETLAQLGYRYRYYLFPSYEHYTHPIVDEWMELARYANLQTRPDAPPHVTFKRDMPFERRVEQGTNVADPITLSLDFDDAWWMRDLTPIDDVSGVATFDGTSLAIPDPGQVTVPEAGGPSSPGQAGPYAMTGLAWLDNPLGAPATSNGFAITLTGARAVTLDLGGMHVASDQPIHGTVDTTGPLQVRLLGRYPTAPVVLVDGSVVAVTVDTDGGITFTIPSSGTHEVTVS